VRTLVDLKESQARALDRLAKRRGRSRASLIREALDDYLAQHCPEGDDEAFGSWGKDAVDGLAYQERARREW
jgi:metal-responsive CopG/Arc/MetJ family transcriptional regulator